VRAALLGILVLAIAFVWIPPADALPSFSGQTGAPCAACHVGGFGPELTAFGISFKANGYTLGGGTGTWSHVPFNVQFEPSLTNLATNRPTPPAGYGTNNFVTPGCASFLIAAGHSFNGNFGIGGIEKVWLNLSNGFVAQSGTVASEGPSDFKFTKPLTLGDHSLLLGFDLNNKPTEGDPYNTLYGYAFPYIGVTNGVSPGASPKISALNTSVYGMTLYALFDNSLYAQAGVYQTFSTSVLNAMGKGAPSQGFIYGSAPYVRIADQHTWGNNFLEIGALWMDVPLQQIPGLPNQSAQNEFVDWGLDATYQRTLGPNTLAITSNFLAEQQTLTGSFAAGKSTYASDSLDQFRIASSYYWHNGYGVTLGYTATWGSTDPKLYPSTALTGSAAGNPNSQAIIAQVDWAPFGVDTTHTGYPWLNARIGLQYTYYLQFNGGTTNYDGHGRNASDNNALLLFCWLSF